MMTQKYERTMLVFLVVSLSLSVHGLLECNLSSPVNGVPPSYHLSPQPDHTCDPMWITREGKELTNGTEYEIAPHKITMREKCHTFLRYRGECVKDGVLSSFGAECSGECPDVAYKEPMANGGLLVAPSACLPVLLTCILAIGLLLLAY